MAIMRYSSSISLIARGPDKITSKQYFAHWRRHRNLSGGGGGGDCFHRRSDRASASGIGYPRETCSRKVTGTKQQRAKQRSLGKCGGPRGSGGAIATPPPSPELPRLKEASATAQAPSHRPTQCKKCRSTSSTRCAMDRSHEQLAPSRGSGSSRA